MTAPIACWRCNAPGHPWTECDLPPAKTRQELASRITDITVRWDAGRGFSRSVKTRIVEIETKQFEKARAA